MPFNPVGSMHGKFTYITMKINHSCIGKYTHHMHPMGMRNAGFFLKNTTSSTTNFADIARCQGHLNAGYAITLESLSLGFGYCL